MADEPLPHRHHYVPQFLLRGFSTRRKGEDYVFVHTPAKSFQSNTKNVAQQRDFHGDPATSRLEQEISRRENTFAPLLQRLIKGEIHADDAPIIRALVVHLSLRTKHLRTGMAEMLNEFLQVVPEVFARKDLKKIHELLKKAVRKEIKESATLRMMPCHTRKWAERVLFERAKQLDVRGILRDGAAAMQDYIDAAALAESTHLKVLQHPDTPDARLKAINHLQWRLLDGPPQPFILGDVVVMAKYAEDAELVSAVSNLGRVEAIYLPVSGRFCLCGNAPDVQVLTSGEINQCSAALSREFFISESAEPPLRPFTELIGTRAQLITREGIRSALEDQA